MGTMTWIYTDYPPPKPPPTKGAVAVLTRPKHCWFVLGGFSLKLKVDGLRFIGTTDEGSARPL